MLTDQQKAKVINLGNLALYHDTLIQTLTDNDTTYQFELDGNTLKMGINNGTKSVIYTPTLQAGTAAGFGTPTATIDNNTGTPSVTVTASGPDTAKVFAFAFSNLKGADGTNGTDGISPSWLTGTAMSGTGTKTVSVSGAKAGDMYLNTSTYDVYKASSASSWIYQCNIKGVAGSNGNNGTSAYWFSGTAVTGTNASGISASVSDSKAGDMYLNTSTYNVYKASAANTWGYVCNIKGSSEEVTLPNTLTYFSTDSGEGVVPTDGMKIQTVTSASTMSINPDVVTVISGNVGTSTITLQVPSDNLAHVWDILMTTGSSVNISIITSNSATIKVPESFEISASKSCEISVIGAGSTYYLRYGEFT